MTDPSYFMCRDPVLVDMSSGCSKDDRVSSVTGLNDELRPSWQIQYVANY
jgi:hypothetical protein